MSRFNGVDDVMTGATPNQRSIINKQQPASQPYPGDVDVAPAPAADGGYRQSVTRSSLQPVSVQQSAAAAPRAVSTLPPPAAAQQVRTASAQLDRTPTGTIAPAAPFKYNQPDPAKAAAETRHAQAQGGKLVVTAQEGDSVNGLARRFNVSSAELMQANNLTPDKGLKIGQKVVIPGYKTVEGSSRVADARPEAPADRKAPAAPAQKVAVLPQQPKLKEGKAVAQVDGSTANSQPKPKEAPRETKVASSAVAGGGYTVQQGDTLSSIARKTGVGVSAIKQANGMQDGILRIGQTLKIPAAGAAPAQAPATAVAAAKPSPDPVVTGSTGQPKKATETLTAYAPPKKDASVIQQAEDDDVAAPGATGIGKMRWPVRGRVISAFGKGSDGVDIAVPEGTPVKAAENGVVIYAGDGLKEFGNTVLVRHEDGLVTVYGHASSLEVQRGQKVKRGQEIARSGMSGTTDSPKLHFEVRKNSAPVNPSTYLE